MQRIFTATSGAVFLAFTTACGPLPVYYKQGAEVSRLQSDELACATQALKDAPVANQIRQHPPVFHPGRQVCHNGNCHYYPGYWSEGSIYTVDVNRPLRQRLEKSCMASKGYQQIALKRCTRSSAGTPIGPRLAPLSEASCAQRNRDGSTVIRSGG
ncbi:hypothetical protein N6L27_01960 [Leisingera sp. SS27]|uniref:hypothetical protein n=1 Tax=Leisingera sp. SS27 TaxID=2979462 RepID=UPI0023312934|nr:hypothetical protein [Leisingera sp. SS27]MDC0656759.1 hypothetical protein [Leisingera sp. SS27]